MIISFPTCDSSLLEVSPWADKIIDQVKMLATKTDDLNLNLRVHKVEREN